MQGQTNLYYLLLVSCHPDNNKDIWVTITEMLDGLDHSGVHSSLSPELVEKDLTRCNK